MTDRAGRLLEALPGSGPARTWRAPGRVNLMGDHTDYNEGLVFPLAIDRDCLAALRPRDDGRVRARSLEVGGVVDVDAGGADDPATVDPAWGRFVAGVVGTLTGRGAVLRGAEIVVSSTVPAGSGLSSSAALSVALTLALADASGLALSPRTAAVAAQDAERAATGVRGGIMDQLTSMLGRRGHALLVDCRSLDVEAVPLPDVLAVLVVHSGLSRTLAGSEYAARRDACEAAAHALGVSTLRDASAEQVAGDRRARHVVAENARVLATADALWTGDTDALGALMLASHASLRDDYEVSTRELDLLVELLVAQGAIGARLTGAGFGGCVIALTPRDQATHIGAETARRYRAACGLEPSAFVVRAVDGAGLV